MANITDLTGYTVTLPSGWTATAWYGVFSVVIEWINPQSSYYIEYGASRSLFLGYDGANQIGARYYNETSSGTYSYWDKITNSQSLSFTITGGTDTTNINLIQWLYDNNATFEKTGGEEEPTPKKKFTKLNIGGAVYSSGGKCFKRLTTELPLNAGLYDADDNLVASWDTLVNTYGMDCEKNYDLESFRTDTASPYYVLTNIPELVNGVKLVIDDSVTSIGEHAFVICDSLTSVIIGNGVTSIGFMAFRNCTSLTSIAIPDSVTTIDHNAFYACTSLQSVVIGSGVTSIGYGVFGFCDSLLNIWVSDGNQHYKDIDGNLYNKDGTTFIEHPVGKTNTDFIIPDSVIIIGENAFWGCESLTSIVIPNSVTTIGPDAFYNCDSLKSITIPDSVIIIGENAFEDCDSLTFVVIGNNVTSIGDKAFRNCHTLIEVCNKSSLNITAGSINNGYVGYYAKHIITDESESHLKYVGDYILYDDGNDGYLVRYCGKETNIVIPDSVTSIGNYAFEDCDSLTSAVIPDSVTSIGHNAFTSCHALKSIVIPDSVTTIGDMAFYNCDSLTSVIIGNGVTSIGAEVFEYCTSLASITIPDSVTEIDVHAFNGCKSLTSVVIPNSVRIISNGAFKGCTSLTDVYYTGSESEWNQIWISSNNEPLTKATKHYDYGKKLSPPTISINGSVISITGSNNVSVRYWIYVDGEDVGSTKENSTGIDIAGLNLEAGTYSVYLVAVADGYENSEPSNTVEYVV